MVIYISDECIVTEYEYTQEQKDELTDKGFIPLIVDNGTYTHEDFEKVEGEWKLK